MEGGSEGLARRAALHSDDVGVTRLNPRGLNRKTIDVNCSSAGIGHHSSRIGQITRFKRVILFGLIVAEP
eukprot:3260777-Alexandrium_andersonii.AAC.1